jgi:hypothetical protein
VNDEYTTTEPRQVSGFYQGRIAAADHDDVHAFKKIAVANGTVRYAGA